MPTGYALLVDGTTVDAEVVYEPIRDGDAKQPVAGHANAAGIDTSDLFTSVASGTALGYNFGYADVQNRDFSAIYAAKNSVPRYPIVLPWDRTVNLNATIYRQPSRPTLGASLILSLSVNRNGSVAISTSAPPYNNNNSNLVTDTLYSSGNVPVWTDAGASPNCPYEVKVTPVSGTAPTMAHGHSLNTWINPNMVVGIENVTMFVRLDYTHSVVEGLKSGNSTIAIALRRTEYPVSNTATANIIVNFALTVEPTVYQNVAWNGTHTAINNAATNYYWPEGERNVYHSAVRMVLSTTRTYSLDIATWKNSETPVWSTILTNQWLRNGFSLSDYEALWTITSGSIDGNDLNPGVGSWLQLGSTSRVLQIQHSVSDATPSATTFDNINGNLRLREISTKGWGVLPDNFAQTNFGLLATVVIQDPQLPPWIATYIWESALNHTVTITRQPEVGTAARAAVYLRFYPDGTVIAVNDAGATIQSGRWNPTSWDPTYFDLRAAGTLNSNPLSSFASPGSPYTQIEYTGVNYTHNSPEGTYDDSGSITVDVRRKAFTSHIDSGSGTSLSRIVVNPPVAPSWGSYIWESALNHIVNVTRVPEGAASVSASVRVRIYTDGTAVAINAADTTIATGRWVPAGWDPTWFSMVLSGTMNTNPFSGAYRFPDNPYTEFEYTAIAYAHSSPEGTYEDSASLNATVRRNAYVNHNDSSGGNSVSRIVVAAPVAPSWIGTYPWEAALNHLKSHTRNTDAPSSTVTASVTILFYQNGGVVVVNGDGGTISSGSWVPPGFTASQFTLQVSGTGIIRNDLATAQVISAAGAAVDLTSVTYANSQPHGTYEDTASFTVTIRRAAYTAHSDSGSGTSVSRVTVAAMPLTINPPSSYDNWAGSFTASVSGAI